jgi:hypothetical protein
MRRVDVFIPPVDPGFEGPLAPSGFDAIFGIITVLVVVGIVVSVIVGVRKWMLLHDAGIDPLTVDARLAATVINSNALRPEESLAPVGVEARLAQLDDLHARGVITADERATARAAILTGPA